MSKEFVQAGVPLPVMQEVPPLFRQLNVPEEDRTNDPLAGIGITNRWKDALGFLPWHVHNVFVSRLGNIHYCISGPPGGDPRQVEGARALGSLIICVHGIGASLDFFSKIQKFLSSHGFTVLSFDLFGHGCSNVKPSELKRAFTQNFFYDELQELLIHLGLAKVRRSYFGFSMGGCLTAYFATRDAEYVDRIILASPAINVPEDMHKSCCSVRCYRRCLCCVPVVAPVMRCVMKQQLVKPVEVPEFMRVWNEASNGVPKATKERSKTSSSKSEREGKGNPNKRDGSVLGEHLGDADLASSVCINLKCTEEKANGGCLSCIDVAVNPVHVLASDSVLHRSALPSLPLCAWTHAYLGPEWILEARFKHFWAPQGTHQFLAFAKSAFGVPMFDSGPTLENLATALRKNKPVGAAVEHIPILVMVGGKDQVISPSEAIKALGGCLSNIHFVIFKNLYHTLSSNDGGMSAKVKATALTFFQTPNDGDMNTWKFVLPVDALGNYVLPRDRHRPETNLADFTAELHSPPEHKREALNKSGLLDLRRHCFMCSQFLRTGVSKGFFTLACGHVIDSDCASENYFVMNRVPFPLQKLIAQCDKGVHAPTDIYHFTCTVCKRHLPYIDFGHNPPSQSFVASIRNSARERYYEEGAKKETRESI